MYDGIGNAWIEIVRNIGKESNHDRQGKSRELYGKGRRLFK